MKSSKETIIGKILAPVWSTRSSESSLISISHCLMVTSRVYNIKDTVPIVSSSHTKRVTTSRSSLKQKQVGSEVTKMDKCVQQEMGRVSPLPNSYLLCLHVLSLAWPYKEYLFAICPCCLQQKHCMNYVSWKIIWNSRTLVPLEINLHLFS
jgi:hypothetical protein